MSNNRRRIFKSAGLSKSASELQNVRKYAISHRATKHTKSLSADHLEGMIA